MKQQIPMKKKKLSSNCIPSEKERILNLINSATTAEDIGGTEHQDGPVLITPPRIQVQKRLLKIMTLGWIFQAGS